MKRKQDDLPGVLQSEGVASERQNLSGGAFYAKTILDRHQIASSARSRLVEKVLQLAYSAAHRRVKGESSWTFEELAVLADHFGETLDDVFAAAEKTKAVAATFVAGDVRLPCRLWVGAEQSSTASAGLVAWRERMRWVVGTPSEGLPGPTFDVHQVLIEANAVQHVSIAVLDDQPAITESLCVFLRSAGFDADAFHSIASLQDALSSHHYDAFVLDWVVGTDTVGPLVEQLRQADALCPIAILTGKANEREEIVTDIADLVAKHDVRYFSKPLDPHMITAVLSRLIPGHARPL